MNALHCSFPRLYAKLNRCNNALVPIYHKTVQVSDGLCHRIQPSRNTLLFERMFPVALCDKERTGPLRPILKRREFVYMLKENTLTKPAGDMDVILTTDIDGLGLEGDVVRVSKMLARTHMLPVGVAEYVTPENLQKYEQTRKERADERRQTMSALRTARQLQSMTLPIPMSAVLPWQLNKSHVRVAFRMVGVVLSEDCIELPEEPITEHKTINIQVTINGMEKVSVKAIVYPYSKTTTVPLPPVWSPDSAASKFSLEELIAQAARKLHLSKKHRSRAT